MILPQQLKVGRRMFLSNLILNPKSWAVQRDLSNIYELHRTLMATLDSDVKREEASLLFRVNEPARGERSLTVLMQSVILPDWTVLEERADYLLEKPVKTKTVNLALNPARSYRFYFRGNPVYRDNASRKIRPVYNAEQMQCWLERVFSKNGMRITPDTILIRKIPRIIAYKKDAEGKNLKVSINPVDFSGVFEIANPDLFKVAWRDGIGKGKAFGCGMLSVANC